MADVDNCFHRIRIDEDLGQYFCLPSFFTAQELNLVGQTMHGRVLEKGDRVRVCCASLPMGFGWSLYFAQKINERKMSESSHLSKSALVNADCHNVVFNRKSNSLYHFVYVDNL